MVPTNNGILDLECIVEVIEAAAIRSGDMLMLDQIATLASFERVLWVTQIISQAASCDPWIAQALNNIEAISSLRAEMLRRKSS